MLWNLWKCGFSWGLLVTFLVARVPTVNFILECLWTQALLVPMKVLKSGLIVTLMLRLLVLTTVLSTLRYLCRFTLLLSRT